MAERAVGSVLSGRRGGHRYRLGARLRTEPWVFWAQDEGGRVWTVRISLRREGLMAWRTWVESLPPGTLPAVRELDEGEIHGVPVWFLVSEYWPGFTLADLLSEGRALTAEESRKLRQDLTEALAGLGPTARQIQVLTPEDCLYDPAQGRWRLWCVTAWGSSGAGDSELGRVLAGVTGPAVKHPAWMAYLWAVSVGLLLAGLAVHLHP